MPPKVQRLIEAEKRFAAAASDLLRHPEAKELLRRKLLEEPRQLFAALLVLATERPPYSVELLGEVVRNLEIRETYIGQPRGVIRSMPRREVLQRLPDVVRDVMVKMDPQGLTELEGVVVELKDARSLAILRPFLAHHALEGIRERGAGLEGIQHDPSRWGKPIEQRFALIQDRRKLPFRWPVEDEPQGDGNRDEDGNG